MGLTESKIRDLEDKKFDELFDKHKGAWLQMVDDAYNFTRVRRVEAATKRKPAFIVRLLPGNHFFIRRFGLGQLPICRVTGEVLFDENPRVYTNPI
jgi:hypothetical protein